jgi:hypothetical protein
LWHVSTMKLLSNDSNAVATLSHYSQKILSFHPFKSTYADNPWYSRDLVSA